MSEMLIHLQSPSRYERIDGVTSFVGIDESGSFGILPRHERMMTVLSPGIMRLTRSNNELEYIGLTAGLLYFVDSQIYISTQKYLRDRDYSHLSAALLKKLEEEEQGLEAMRETIRKMEEALLNQLVRSPGVKQL